MATTTLLQRHAGEGETIAEAIRDCLDYGKDPEKTESGKYISAYECDPATVADEFLSLIHILQTEYQTRQWLSTG